MRIIQLCSIVALSIACASSVVSAAGPLRIHPDNPRYFTDGSGRAIYLTGSHVWNNLADMGPGDAPPSFDFDAYLDFLAKYGHNFIRLWAWEHSTWDTSANGRWGKKTPHTVAPHPWARTGPHKALDGKPKFDLTKFDPKYFQRLRSRVSAASRRDIYVSVMLFEGWGVQFAPGAWAGHPLNAANNTSGINDPQWEPVRRAMGYTLQFAKRANLIAMTPRGDLTSTNYCLADPGREYLVYAPAGGQVKVDLSATKGELTVEWFDPTKGKSIEAGKTTGGVGRQFTAPFDGHAVLYLAR